jgi:single-stranded DNA-binding protein
MAAVDGQIRIETWEKDGERKYKTVINADNVRFLSPKSEAPSEMRLEEIDINSDDLPF